MQSRKIVSYTSIVFFLLLCSTLSWGKGNIKPGLIVSTSWLEAHLGDPGVVIVHVEEVEDATDHYAGGHIPGAHFVAQEYLGITRRGIDGMLPTLHELIKLVRGLGISERTKKGRHKKGHHLKKVVIYGPEHPFGAARLFHALDYLGLRDVLALLDGHFPRWKEEGRPTTDAVPDPTYSDFVPTVNPRALIERGAVGDLMSALAGRMADPALDVKGVVLFDSRNDSAYGAGHIPGAVQAFSVLNFEGWWNDWADARTWWVLVPRKEIVDRFEALGLGRKGDLAITSCTTGLAGALLYHTLAYAGFDVALYDGSFNEWSTIEISDNDDDELKIWRSVYPGYAGQADGRLPVVTGLEPW
jgi:thiosulfate/3-mercaptopyruvate sulfurtransferase